jgi:hypothetical protein
MWNWFWSRESGRMEGVEDDEFCGFVHMNFESSNNCRVAEIIQVMQYSIATEK